ncbi:MAG: hypothetical protein V1773_07240 [bacterium]
MIRKILFFTLFIFTATCSPNNKGNNTPEELGITIFQSFLNNNIEEFKKYIMTADDFIKLLDSSSYSEKKKAKYIIKYNNDIPVIYKQIVNDFTLVKDEAKNNKIDWDKIEFEKIEYKDGRSIYMRYAHINLIFNYNGTKYFIRLNDCLNTARGWLISGNVYLSVYPVY